MRKADTFSHFKKNQTNYLHVNEVVFCTERIRAKKPKGKEGGERQNFSVKTPLENKEGTCEFPLETSLVTTLNKGLSVGKVILKVIKLCCF